jgi:hypothetical protein
MEDLSNPNPETATTAKVNLNYIEAEIARFEKELKELEH